VTGVTLDTGALIAIERGDRRLQALLEEATAAGAHLAVPAGVVAQAWRGSNRQARLARFLGLAMVSVIPMDDPQARAAGVLCGRAGTMDMIDASVVICARTLHHAVITGNPDDLAALDPALRIVAL
jgi:predicted nucleic acid-binding protein